jgi:hypothetical protein
MVVSTILAGATIGGYYMFAVIYRGRVYPEAEEDYQKLWHKIAHYFIEYRGALGSCLHKTVEGDWVAYSRWPDKNTRDASWPKEGEEPCETLSQEIQEVILSLKKCIDKDQPFQEICMEVVDDLLLKGDKQKTF